MRKLSTAEARESFAEIVNEAAFGGKRTVITRRGKDVAAIVPINELAPPQPLTEAAEGSVIVQVKQVNAPLSVTPARSSELEAISMTFGGGPKKS